MGLGRGGIRRWGPAGRYRTQWLPVEFVGGRRRQTF